MALWSEKEGVSLLESRRDLSKMPLYVSANSGKFQSKDLEWYL